MSFYLEPDSYSRNMIKVDLHSPNNVTNSDVEKATGIDTFELAKRTDVVTLKSKADRTNINKPKAVQTDLSQLSNVVKNDV